MSTDRPTTSRPSRDAFWSLILTELRSNVMFLDPQFYDFDISSASDALSSFNIERERLISQLDDALELSTGRLSAVSSAASVNLHQVAADFAESYARRFGSESGRAISVLVDHKLPHIRTNPAQLLRLLDTLVRSAQRSTVTRKVELRLRESGTTKLLSTDCQLVLRCTGITLPITVSEAQRLLFDCTTELSFRAVRSAREAVEKIQSALSPE